MKKIFTAIYCAMMIGALLVPATTFAQNPGQKGYYILNFECTGNIIAGTDSNLKNSWDSGERTCNFQDFMTLIERIIKLLLYVATILAVISFVYAGFLLLFSGGNEDALKHAKHIFVSVLIGLVLAFGAWLIVRFVLVTLGVKQDQNYTLIDGIK
jgi:type IV secretory pathway VirB2 component (pilin)